MTLFDQKVLKFGPRFRRDLSLTDAQVAGLFGNFWVETGGFTALQEKNPLVAGSRGGWGWAQWTGSRRRAFERWADKNNLSRSDDETNYQYVVYELKNIETAAYNALLKTKTPKAAAETVCLKYERPGIQHMGNRIKWAEHAFTLLSTVRPTPTRKTPTTSTTNWSAFGALASGILAVLGNPWVQGIAVLLMAAFAGYIIYERNKRIAYDLSVTDDGPALDSEAPLDSDATGSFRGLQDMGTDGRPEDSGEVSGPDGPGPGGAPG